MNPQTVHAQNICVLFVDTVIIIQSKTVSLHYCQSKKLELKICIKKLPTFLA
ncbi:unnamed protein product [Acanthoscelides obtectus]|uniref:Uncharacterized protein n=1 Tax=Acanthoscelides obtectus TaxID=200917 RepID=A0A9P0LB62_ACAOB|nr:unnamed protein product [Acanthoscelides obtectus]CAK1643229.1 hypothetical protein AOBTE_LOCUS13456 [Acanthoscelides obtectus]